VLVRAVKATGTGTGTEGCAGPPPADSCHKPHVEELERVDEADAADLDGYGASGQTGTDQLAAARTRADFRQWDAREAAAMERWLRGRAMEHEGYSQDKPERCSSAWRVARERL
jgi:hypothetical protein